MFEGGELTATEISFHNLKIYSEKIIKFLLEAVLSTVYQFPQ